MAKKSLLIGVLLAAALSMNPSWIVEKPEEICDMQLHKLPEKKFSKKIDEEIKIDIEKIIQIESSGNPHAYNSQSKARGLMQITPVVLNEWNAINQVKYKARDLFNPKINKKIGEWYFCRIKDLYLEENKLNMNIENILASYNWGIGNVSRIKDARENFSLLPEETKNYILKYRGVVD